jgi:peptidoglycan hydrolase CwlO-like protein
MNKGPQGEPHRAIGVSLRGRRLSEQALDTYHVFPHGIPSGTLVARPWDSIIPNSKSQIPNLKFQISNLKFQISNLKSQIPNLKSQISNLKFQIPDCHTRHTQKKKKTAPTQTNGPCGRSLRTLRR